MADIFGDSRRKESLPIPPTALAGPADADHYRIKVGRWGTRWYTDPLPGCDVAGPNIQEPSAWPSVSAVKKVNDKDWTFVGLRRVRDAIVARGNAKFLEGLPADEILDTLSGINKRALSSAAQRGTNVHWYMECGLRGLPIEVRHEGELGSEYLPAVKTWFATYKPKLVAAETVFINRTMAGIGYGGTGDAIVEIDDVCYMLDWKSRGPDSDHGAYPEEAAQVGAYAAAEYMITEGPEGARRQRLPELASGLIVSIRPDGMREYPTDLVLGAKQFEAMLTYWGAKREERKALGRPWPPRKAVQEGPRLSPLASVVEMIDAANSTDDLTAIYLLYKAVWTDELTERAKVRKVAITKK